MNKYFYIAGVVIIAVALFIFFTRDTNPELPPPKNQIIVAFGDSLVAGYGSTEGNDFVSLLSKKIGKPIINKGQNGDTTASAPLRIDDVLSENPGIVILLLGGNDYLRQIPKDVTFANLAKIVAKLKENNIRILLLGIRGGLLKDNYRELFDDFAKKNNLPYVPNVLDGILGDQELMSDAVHPNDKGYEIVANKVLPVLKNMMQ